MMNASAAGFFVSRLALGARAREEGQTVGSLGAKRALKHGSTVRIASSRALRI